MTRRALASFALLAASTVWATGGGAALGAAPEFEYRAVFASAATLERQLDELGRESYGCVSVARPDPGTALPGVVVLLGRVAHMSAPAVAHRVVVGGREDARVPLDRAGAEGFRLCGAVLDEEAPSPRLVVVMSHTATATTWRYGVEVLLRYNESLIRLNAAGRDGFVPVAAAPIDNNRVADQRNWMVITERSSADSGPREIAVRSDLGATSLSQKLNESGKQGYRADVLWKEGSDVVAMMSRPAGSGPPARSFAVAAGDITNVHSFSRACLGDFVYHDERLFVMDAASPASNEVIDEPLPSIGAAGFADARALGIIGDHISRNHGYRVAYARVHRDGGKFALTTVITERK